MNSRPNLTAIIYDKRGKVLSIGKNSYVKTHPLQKKYAEKVGMAFKEKLHAEIAAIIKCKSIESAHSIKIFRFDKNGNPALAKPCAICESALKAVGINNVYHT